MCTRSLVSQCGWAFCSVTWPWVAQRVADAGGAVQVAVARGHSVAQAGEVAHRVDTAHRAVLDQREEGGVIPAVLQTLQSLQQQVAAIARPDVSDDPAHGRISLTSIAPFRANLETISSHSSSPGASTITRTSGSVPEERTSTRPRLSSRPTPPRRRPTPPRRRRVPGGRPRARSRAAEAARHRVARGEVAPGKRLQHEQRAAVPSPAGTKPVSIT